MIYKMCRAGQYMTTMAARSHVCIVTCLVDMHTISSLCDVHVVAACLVDMYAKCGSIKGFWIMSEEYRSTRWFLCRTMMADWRQVKTIEPFQQCDKKRWSFLESGKVECMC